MQTSPKTFGRLALVQAMCKGDPASMRGYVESQPWSDKAALLDEINKAATSPMTVGGTTALTNAVTRTSFLEALRGAAILSSPMMAAARHVATNTRILTLASGATGYLVPENAPTPISSVNLTSMVLRALKHQAAEVLTAELARLMLATGPEALTQDLVGGVGLAEDRSFLSPSAPTSITFGLTAQVGSGSTAAAFDSDFKTAVGTFATAKSRMKNIVAITGVQEALALGLLRGTGDALAYPGLGATGGTIAGIPLLATSALSGVVVFVDLDGLVICDDGNVGLDSTSQGNVQMSDSPDSPDTGSTVLVSMFQSNLIASRATIFRGWFARPSAVLLLNVGF